MTKYIKPLLGLLAFAMLCIGTAQGIKLHKPQAKPQREPVVLTKVVDGDTVYLGEQCCRLAGVDAPEKEFKGRWPEQPGAMAARGYVVSNLKDKKLTAKWGGRDKYGRQLVTLFVEGQDFNAELVRYGLAWSYDKTYAAEQRLAERGQWGLWADDTAISPGRWRKGERAEVANHEDDE